MPTETKPQKAHSAAALADLLDLIGMTRWLGFVCVGVVVVLVANSVVMSAQDRGEGARRVADARLLRPAGVRAHARPRAASSASPAAWSAPRRASRS